MAKQDCFTKIAVSLALAAGMVMVSPPVSAAQTVAAAPAVKSTPKSKTPARATKTPRKRAYSAANARARRAQLARARAEARVRELRELQTPRFTVDEYGREVPDVRAEAAIIYNPEPAKGFGEITPRNRRPLAALPRRRTRLFFLTGAAYPVKWWRFRAAMGRGARPIICATASN